MKMQQEREEKTVELLIMEPKQQNNINDIHIEYKLDKEQISIKTTNQSSHHRMDGLTHQNYYKYRHEMLYENRQGRYNASWITIYILFWVFLFFGALPSIFGTINTKTYLFQNIPQLTKNISVSERDAIAECIDDYQSVSGWFDARSFSFNDTIWYDRSHHDHIDASYFEGNIKLGMEQRSNNTFFYIYGDKNAAIQMPLTYDTMISLYRYNGIQYEWSVSSSLRDINTNHSTDWAILETIMFDDPLNASQIQCIEDMLYDKYELNDEIFANESITMPAPEETRISECDRWSYRNTHEYIIAWYDINNAFDGNNVLYDLSTNNNDITLDPNIKIGVDETNGFKYLYGSPNDTINIPITINDQNYIIYYVARFNGNSKGSILTDISISFECGFSGGESGVCYLDNTEISYDYEERYGDDWVLTSFYKLEMEKSQDIIFFYAQNGETGRRHTNGDIEIDTLSLQINGASSSDWALSEIIIASKGFTGLAFMPFVYTMCVEEYLSTKYSLPSYRYDLPQFIWLQWFNGYGFMMIFIISWGIWLMTSPCCCQQPHGTGSSYCIKWPFDLTNQVFHCIGYCCPRCCCCFCCGCGTCCYNWCVCLNCCCGVLRGSCFRHCCACQMSIFPFYNMLSASTSLSSILYRMCRRRNELNIYFLLNGCMKLAATIVHFILIYQHLINTQANDFYELCYLVELEICIFIWCIGIIDGLRNYVYDDYWIIMFIINLYLLFIVYLGCRNYDNEAAIAVVILVLIIVQSTFIAISILILWIHECNYLHTVHIWTHVLRCAVLLVLILIIGFWNADVKKMWAFSFVFVHFISLYLDADSMPNAEYYHYKLYSLKNSILQSMSNAKNPFKPLCSPELWKLDEFEPSKMKLFKMQFHGGLMNYKNVLLSNPANLHDKGALVINKKLNVGHSRYVSLRHEYEANTKYHFDSVLLEAFQEHSEKYEKKHPMLNAQDIMTLFIFVKFPSIRALLYDDIVNEYTNFVHFHRKLLYIDSLYSLISETAKTIQSGYTVISSQIWIRSPIIFCKDIDTAHTLLPTLTDTFQGIVFPVKVCGRFLSLELLDKRMKDIFVVLKPRSIEFLDYDKETFIEYERSLHTYGMDGYHQMLQFMRPYMDSKLLEYIIQYYHSEWESDIIKTLCECMIYSKNDTILSRFLYNIEMLQTMMERELCWRAFTLLIDDNNIDRISIITFRKLCGRIKEYEFLRKILFLPGYQFPEHILEQMPYEVRQFPFLERYMQSKLKHSEITEDGQQKKDIFERIMLKYEQILNNNAYGNFDINRLRRLFDRIDTKIGLVQLLDISFNAKRSHYLCQNKDECFILRNWYKSKELYRSKYMYNQYNVSLEDYNKMELLNSIHIRLFHDDVSHYHQQLFLQTEMKDFGLDIISHSNLKPRFGDTKQEWIQNDYFPMEKNVYDLLYQKSEILAKTHQNKSRYNLSVKHILCIKMFIDTIDLRSCFISSFRRASDSKLRSEFAHWAIMFSIVFVKIEVENELNDEWITKQTLYHGLDGWGESDTSKVCESLHGPLSTTWNRNISVNLAVRNEGVMLAIPQNTNVIKVDWLSSYDIENCALAMNPKIVIETSYAFKREIELKAEDLKATLISVILDKEKDAFTYLSQYFTTSNEWIAESKCMENMMWDQAFVEKIAFFDRKECLSYMSLFEFIFFHCEHYQIADFVSMYYDKKQVFDILIGSFFVGDAYPWLVASERSKRLCIKHLPIVCNISVIYQYGINDRSEKEFTTENGGKEILSNPNMILQYIDQRRLHNKNCVGNLNINMDIKYQYINNDGQKNAFRVWNCNLNDIVPIGPDFLWKIHENTAITNNALYVGSLWITNNASITYKILNREKCRTYDDYIAHNLLYFSIICSRSVVLDENCFISVNECGIKGSEKFEWTLIPKSDFISIYNGKNAHISAGGGKHTEMIGFGGGCCPNIDGSKGGDGGGNITIICEELIMEQGSMLMANGGNGIKFGGGGSGGVITIITHKSNDAPLYLNSQNNSYPHQIKGGRGGDAYQYGKPGDDGLFRLLPNSPNNIAQFKQLIENNDDIKAEPESFALNKFTQVDVARKIKEWIQSDIDFNANITKTKQIFSKRSFDGKTMTMNTMENAKALVKDDLSSFMSQDTINIIFNWFQSLNRNAPKTINDISAEEIGTMFARYPFCRLLTVIHEQVIDGKQFIERLKTNNFIKKETGWSDDEVYQIQSVLLKHYTVPYRQFVENMHYILKSFPQMIREEIKTAIVSFNVEELQFNIKNGLCIDDFSDTIINLVDNIILNVGAKDDLVHKIYEAIAGCFMVKVDNKDVIIYQPQWICYNCSNSNVMTFINKRINMDLSTCSLCGIHQKQSIIIKIKNQPNFVMINDEYDEYDEDMKEDDNINQMICDVLDGGVYNLICPNRNDNKHCPSIIRLSKKLIVYKRWLNTVYQKKKGKVDIDKTIEVDIAAAVDVETYKSVFIESAKSVKGKDLDLLLKWIADNVDEINDINMFLSMSRKAFGKHIQQKTKIKLASGVRLWSAIMYKLKTRAQTIEYGQFLSDLDMNRIDNDYHHILTTHINKGNVQTIQNVFTFFGKLIHYDDGPVEIAQCRSVERNGERIKEINDKERNKKQLNDNENNNIWELKQLYNQGHLDMIHTFLVHSDWTRFVHGDVDENKEEEHIDDFKLSMMQNKEKYITDLTGYGNNRYGFGVDHNHPDLSPKHNSIHYELLLNPMCPVQEGLYQKLLIKALKRHGIALSPQYRDELICKYFNNQYNLIRNQSIGIRHIFAIVAYTDMSAFCTEYRKTYRLVDDETTEQQVTERHRELYYYSRAVFEAIEFFGEWMKSDLKVYHGLNVVLKFESFNAFFNQPISTTTYFQTAIQFSDGQGIVLSLKSGADTANDPSKIPKYLAVAWLSSFPNEEERLFYGAYVNFQIHDIWEVHKQQGHLKELLLLNKWQNMVRNKKVIWDLNRNKDKKRLNALISLIKGKDKDEYMTDFGRDLFSCFCANSNAKLICIQSFESLPTALKEALFCDNKRRFSLIPICNLFPNLEEIVLNELEIQTMVINGEEYDNALLEYIHYIDAKENVLKTITFKSKLDQNGKQNSTLKKMAERCTNKYAKYHWKIQYRYLEKTHNLVFSNTHHNIKEINELISELLPQNTKQKEEEEEEKKDELIEFQHNIPPYFIQITSIDEDDFKVEVIVHQISNEKRRVYLKEIQDNNLSDLGMIVIKRGDTSGSIDIPIDDDHNGLYHLALFNSKRGTEPIIDSNQIQFEIVKDPIDEDYKPNPIDVASSFKAMDNVNQQINVYWNVPSQSFGEKIQYKVINDDDQDHNIISSLPYCISLLSMPKSFRVITMTTIKDKVYESEHSEPIVL